VDNSDLLVWMHSNKVKHACVLGKLTGVDDAYDLDAGISFEGRFPRDAEYSLHPDFPNDLVLTDSLINSDGLIVVSAKLRKVFEKHVVPKVEYHPVLIRDHKGKVFSQDYCILHPIDPIVCLDHEASGASPSFILPDVVDSVEKLVLDREQVPADRPFFRIAGFHQATLVRRDLAAELDKGRYTGFRWLELSAYPEV
jgi:hypothetical protein